MLYPVKISLKNKGFLDIQKMHKSIIIRPLLREMQKEHFQAEGKYWMEILTYTKE